MGTPARADERFDCHGPAVPKRAVACQTKVEYPDGGEPFSCGNARTHDQVVYCGAVYGYEQGWCLRIADPALRRKCFRDTE